MAELTDSDWTKVAALGLRHLQTQVAAFQSGRCATACNGEVHQALDDARAALARAEAIANGAMFSRD